MREAGFVIALLLVGLGPATAQTLPDPLPENNPDAHALADSLYMYGGAWLRWLLPMLGLATLALAIWSFVGPARKALDGTARAFWLTAPVLPLLIILSDVIRAGTDGMTGGDCPRANCTTVRRACGVAPWFGSMTNPAERMA